MDHEFITDLYNLMQNNSFFSYREQEILQAEKRTNNGDLWYPVNFEYSPS